MTKPDDSPAFAAEAGELIGKIGLELAFVTPGQAASAAVLDDLFAELLVLLPATAPAALVDGVTAAAERLASVAGGGQRPSAATIALLELIDEFGVRAERTLMIGDTTHDLQLALNAGTASLGVSFGAHDHGAFGAFEPRFVAHSTAELHRWLVDHA